VVRLLQNFAKPAFLDFRKRPSTGKQIRKGGQVFGCALMLRHGGRLLECAKVEPSEAGFSGQKKQVEGFATTYSASSRWPAQGNRLSISIAN
jgi:hypothetical protein